MTTLREAAAAALEALELGYDAAKTEADQYHAAMAGYRPQRHAQMDADVQKIAAAITALRAALAEFDAEPTKEGQTQTDSKQEPVANHSEDDLDMVKCRQIAREYAWPNSNIDSGNLYWALHVALRHAAPPQRQPLTQDEAWEIWDALADRGKKGEDIVHAFARAIERAHGIGGKE